MRRTVTTVAAGAAAVAAIGLAAAPAGAATPLTAKSTGTTSTAKSTSALASGTVAASITDYRCDSMLAAQSYQDENGYTGVNQFVATYWKQFLGTDGRWHNELLNGRQQKHVFKSVKFVDTAGRTYIYWPNSVQDYGWTWASAERGGYFRINITFQWKNAGGAILAKKALHTATCHLV
jgi:hypothetical protein